MLYYILHPMLGLPYYGIGFTPQYVYPLFIPAVKHAQFCATPRHDKWAKAAELSVLEALPPTGDFKVFH